MSDDKLKALLEKQRAIRKQIAQEKKRAAEKERAAKRADTDRLGSLCLAAGLEKFSDEMLQPRLAEIAKSLNGS